MNPHVSNNHSLYLFSNSMHISFLNYHFVYNQVQKNQQNFPTSGPPENLSQSSNFSLFWRCDWSVLLFWIVLLFKDKPYTSFFHLFWAFCVNKCKVCGRLSSSNYCCQWHKTSLHISLSPMGWVALAVFTDRNTMTFTLNLLTHTTHLPGYLT